MIIDKIKIEAQGADLERVVNALKALPPNTFQKKGVIGSLEPKELKAVCSPNAVTTIYPRSQEVGEIRVPDEAKSIYIDICGGIKFNFKDYCYLIYQKPQKND